MRKTLFDSRIVGLGAFVVPLFHDSTAAMNALSAAAAAVIPGDAVAAASGTLLLLSVTMILASALYLTFPRRRSSAKKIFLCAHSSISHAFCPSTRRLAAFPFALHFPLFAFARTDNTSHVRYLRAFVLVRISAGNEQ